MAEEATIIAFLNALTHHKRRRRQRVGRSSLESRASGLSDLGDDEGEEEDDDDEEEEEEEEMEYLALNYPQEDSGDDTDAYAPRFP